jgi:ribosomal protein S27AE
MSQLLQTYCPNCLEQTVFYANGQQHWPQAVADAHGLPAIINLWTCTRCGSTRSETDLLPDSNTDQSVQDAAHPVPAQSVAMPL